MTSVVPRDAPHTPTVRGDAGMIVTEYRFGNTVCKINDALIAKTPEEREQIDEQIATAAYACLEDGGDESAGPVPGPAG